LPITVLIAARNEAANISRCLAALKPAQRVVLLDSASNDGTAELARQQAAEVVQFHYGGGYPKKRQWALDTLDLRTPWILLLDADEVVSPLLWSEIRAAIEPADAPAAFLIRKEFHFLGRRFRFGGFSHQAVLLFRTGRARFERLLENDPSAFDMEVHERVIVNGSIGRLRMPLIHEDFKGLTAYKERHEQYAIWEAALRHDFLSTGKYGADAIPAKLTGNSQERRRFLKKCVMRLPFEPLLWFIYHYLARGGFLEGRAGWVACRIRADYIRTVRKKIRAFQQHGAGPTRLPRSQTVTKA
jgi:glycosyltransferase involved in cell wall biosynthesis